MSENNINKKIILLVISILLFCMFLSYSGFLRDKTNPLNIARYHWVCIGNREGFLTYHISSPEFFNEDKLGVLYTKYRMNSIDRADFDLLSRDEDRATIRIKVIYKDKTISYLNMTLGKKEKAWLIDSIK